jgi:hypothetical protein
MSRTTLKADLLNDIHEYSCGEVPSPLQMLMVPVIGEWTTEVRRIGKEFKLIVRGQVRRHPDYDDGDAICTEAVVWFDRKSRWIRTRHRLYALGEPAGEEIGVDGVAL